MSAKIAVISSMTWLIGWMRPVSRPDVLGGSETSTASLASRASSPASRKRLAPRGERLHHAVLGGIDGGACDPPLLRRHFAETREEF